MTFNLNGWRFTQDIYLRSALDFGSELPDYLEIAARMGELQRYCQNALRRYMLDGPANTLREDGGEVGGVCAASSLPPYTFQIALALSIPAPDYSQLAEFASYMVDEPGEISAWFPNFPTYIKADACQLYEMPSTTLAQMKKLTGAGQEQILRHLIKHDNLTMAKKFFAEVDAPFRKVAPTNAKSKILKAIAEIPFGPSKIRDWLVPDHSITMQEIHARLKYQIRALERDPREVSVSIAESQGAKDSDHKLHELPRYAEYLNRHAQDMGVSLWVGIDNISGQSPHPETSRIINKLYADVINTLGEGRKAFFINHLPGRIETMISDLEDNPAEMQRFYLDHLHNEYITAKKNEDTSPSAANIRRSLVSLLLKKESFPDILEHFEDDDSKLEFAFKVTGNKKYIEHISDSGLQNLLGEDLGL